MYDYKKLVRFENSSKAIQKGSNSFLVIRVQYILNSLLLIYKILPLKIEAFQHHLQFDSYFWLYAVITR